VEPVTTPIIDETPDGFLAHSGDCVVEPYLLPWGRRIHLRGLSGMEVQQYYRGLARMKNPDSGDVEVADPYADAKFLVLAMAKADGSPFLPADSYMRVAAMLNQYTRPIARRAMELSALGEEAIKDLLKNSKATPNSGSGSGSPPTGGAPSTPSAG
jgi:hypothetical protein